MEKIVIVSLIVIVFLALVGVLGDYFIKRASQENRFIVSFWFYLGLIVYALVAFGWVFAMKHVKLSTLGVFYALTTVIALTLLGVFYFGEKLNNYEVAGIITAIVSILLLGRFV